MRYRSCIGRYSDRELKPGSPLYRKNRYLLINPEAGITCWYAAELELEINLFISYFEMLGNQYRCFLLLPSCLSMANFYEIEQEANEIDNCFNILFFKGHLGSSYRTVSFDTRI
jgi:hypothetical protein